jgi:hypothetical protein
MDAFDFAPEPEEKPEQNFRDLVLKLGTYYFLAGSLCLLGFFIAIYLNPYLPINPFPPAQPVLEQAPTTVTQPTETAAPAETALPAETATPEPSATPEVAADMPTPTETITPYPTATQVVLATDVPSATLAFSGRFKAQDGTPSYLPYSGGCNGIYLAGYVLDAENNPLVHMTVRAVGVVDGQQISVQALSGSNTDYTESGWELKLFDSAIKTTGQFSVALYKQGSIQPVSDEVTFDTFSSCTQNLTVINFVQED